MPGDLRACSPAVATTFSLPTRCTPGSGGDAPALAHLLAFLQPGPGHDGVAYAIRPPGGDWLSVAPFNASDLGKPLRATADNLPELWQAPEAIALRCYGLARVLLIDLDAGSRYHPAADGGLALGRILDACRSRGLWVDHRHAVIRSSASGGLHVLFAFPEALPANLLGALGEAIAADAGLELVDGELEAYPERQRWEPGTPPPQRQAVRVPLQPASGAAPLRVIRSGDAALLTPSGESVADWFAGLIAAADRHDVDAEALAELQAPRSAPRDWKAHTAARSLERRQRREERAQARAAFLAGATAPEPTAARHPGRLADGFTTFAGAAGRGRTNETLRRLVCTFDPTACRQDPHAMAERLREELAAHPAWPRASRASRLDVARSWPLRWVRWRGKRAGGPGPGRGRHVAPDAAAVLALDNDERAEDCRARQRIAEAFAVELRRHGLEVSDGTLRAAGRVLFGLGKRAAAGLELAGSRFLPHPASTVRPLPRPVLRPRHFAPIAESVRSLPGPDAACCHGPRHPLAVAVAALVELTGQAVADAVAALAGLLADLPGRLVLPAVETLQVKASELLAILQPGAAASTSGPQAITPVRALATVTPIGTAPSLRPGAAGGRHLRALEASGCGDHATGQPDPRRPAAGTPPGLSAAAKPPPSGLRCSQPIRRALRAVADRCRVGKKTAAAVFQLAFPVRQPLPVRVPEALPEALPHLRAVPDQRRSA
jgi:virulence-associated protein VagC